MSITLHTIATSAVFGGQIDLDQMSAFERGGGGTAGFLGLSKAMSEIEGYEVKAFCDVKEEKNEQNIEYLKLDRFKSFKPADVTLVYYDMSPFVEHRLRSFTIASHHSYGCFGDFPEYAFVHVAPSQHAVLALKKKYGGINWHVLPNGVADQKVLRDPVPGRVVHHVSPARGLHWLLAAWPKIKEQISDATLHVIGDLNHILSGIHPVYENIVGHFREFMPKAEAAGGLRLLGRLSRVELLKELSEASVFAYPADTILPTETFSISTMECCQIGIPVVMSPCDSLSEIYEGSVILTPPEPGKNLREFVNAVICMLASVTHPAKYSLLGKALASKYTFERQAKHLDQIIRCEKGT